MSARLLAVLLCLSLAGVALAPRTQDAPAATDAAALDITWGTEDYVEWRPGDAPLIVSVPHGGGLRPDALADREEGLTVRDGRTAEFGIELVRAYERATGTRPHLVLCHLHRSKLDANRPLEQAAQGDAAAERAWREYHAFVERAKAAVVERHGAGLYVDLHGQSHPEGWIEWGYAVSADSLAAETVAGPSSIDHLARRSGRSLTDLLRGPQSLGARTEALGHASVPSPAHPAPGEGRYFEGGYSTRRHGSRAGGTIDGVQLELPRSLRIDPGRRETACAELAGVLRAFLVELYGIGTDPRNRSGEPAPGSGDGL